MTDEKLKMANNIRHVLYSYEHEIKMLENAMVDGQRISLHVIDWRVAREQYVVDLSDKYVSDELKDMTRVILERKLCLLKEEFDKLKHEFEKI